MAVRPIRLELVVAGCALMFLLMGVFAAVVASRYDRRQEDISAKSASVVGLAVPPRETDEEMEQRLKWHWAAINKCRNEGGYAAMGFDDEVLCLRYPSLWWAFDGKGPL